MLSVLTRISTHKQANRLWTGGRMLQVWIYFSGVIIVLGQFEDDACLRELPISKLLRIKKSLQELTCDADQCPSSSEDKYRSQLGLESRIALGDGVTISGANPALPLIGSHLRRSHDPWDEKPSKLQNIFQLSITALSFLAFGGYLLCMIVQAIKSKGTTYFHPATNTNTNTNNDNGNIFRKVKVYKRSRRFASKKNSTVPPIHGPQFASPSPDELYKAMIYVAEGYVKIAS